MVLLIVWSWYAGNSVVGGVVSLADSDGPAAAAEQPSDDAIMQNLGRRHI